MEQITFWEADRKILRDLWHPKVIDLIPTQTNSAYVLTTPLMTKLFLYT